jgi:hypothetical protein
MAIKTFTTGEVLTAADTNTYLANSGLVLVKSQTVGAGVGSVTVSSAFNSTYDNYHVIYSGGTQSTSTGLKLTLGSANTQYYHWMVYGSYSGGAGAPQGSGQNNVAQFSWVGGGDSSSSISDFDLFAPNKASYTWFRMNGFYAPFGNAGFNSGVLKDTTQYTAFTLTAEAGTMSGGTITVYGYRLG